MYKKRGNHLIPPFSGLKGTKIEPLVPLLTFIGDLDLDKSIDNEHVVDEHKKGRNKSTVRKKKKGIHF